MRVRPCASLGSTPEDAWPAASAGCVGGGTGNDVLVRAGGGCIMLPKKGPSLGKDAPFFLLGVFAYRPAPTTSCTRTLTYEKCPDKTSVESPPAPDLPEKCELDTARDAMLVTLLCAAATAFTVPHLPAAVAPARATTPSAMLPDLPFNLLAEVVDGTGERGPQIWS